TEELIGYRAQALAKHKDHVDQMRARVKSEKIERLHRYEQEHKHTIKEYNFKPKSLVLIRNKAIESSLNKKMKPRYLGPMVVIARTKGGAYIVAELDGSVFQEQIAAARVIPYFAREELNLPQSVLDWIDISAQSLEKLKRQPIKDNEIIDFNFDKVKMNPESDNLSEEEVNEAESNERPADNVQSQTDSDSEDTIF